MEATREITKKKEFFSKPLFKQSIKSNLGLWLALTIGSMLIFVIINLVVGTKQIFTNINMGKVMVYVEDENISLLKVLGLLDQMGFNLNRIQTMSQIDMNAVMNDLVYKIAGVLLPMIYVMITCNKLIASQVSDGSMAYILSTPTNRKKVVRTQYAFMVSSLFVMYVVIALGAFISGAVAWFVTKPANLPFGAMTLRTFLYCFGSFIAMFALTGVAFGASCWFNKSNQSIAVGGGACVLAFLCCILGLFGNKVFVSVGVGVQAMDFFNYLTIYTLIDTEGMGNFAKAINGVENVVMTIDWLWKLAILVGIGGIFAFIGSYKFTKKDLPL
ncbi:MAG: ABC-2 transporter permease [Firmicutes bacterium]|nr:ABC-2 transporter permease [Candidatus Fiminaster equi]